jgi:hypothetical protein
LADGGPASARNVRLIGGAGMFPSAIEESERRAAELRLQLILWRLT